ncbi:MAG TPA: homoserine dehydrogenase [Blastocatellia bacterium]|nr:homoserine dehydrogenase [Blastocatellia bacterium]
MKIAIAGLGNVGRAFGGLLAERREWLRSEFGTEIKVTAVSDRSGVVINDDGLDLTPVSVLYQTGRRPPDTSIAFLKETRQPLTKAGAVAATPAEAVRLFAEAGVQAVIETLPSGLETQGEPAITIVTEALNRGLHVVTANKAVLLFAGPKLERLAAGKGVKLAHSGATCAALPTLSFARRELIGARIIRIRGILNGTTNNILTRMNEDGLSFTDALAEAQDKGIAEPDPRYDVEGWDSAAKLVILANVLMNADATLEQVERKGIDEIPERMIEGARSAGRAIKLIALAHPHGEGVRLSVSPQAVSPQDQMYSVRHSNKAVEFQTDLYGPLLVAGGASSRAAVAATLLKDVISLL